MCIEKKVCPCVCEREGGREHESGEGKERRSNHRYRIKQEFNVNITRCFEIEQTKLERSFAALCFKAYNEPKQKKTFECVWLHTTSAK